MMGLFGKKKDPKEQVRELQRKLRQETRGLDRQIVGIQREQQKVEKEIKDHAKKGDREACMILAKSILQSRKAISKIHVSKAQINSVVMSMNEQVAALRMAGSLQSSTEVMKNMQSLIKVPEIMKAMREMSMEMTKLGIIEDMIEDTMESMEPAGLEEQAQKEVDQILYEITEGELGKAPAASTGPLAAEEEPNAEEIAAMTKRLAQLQE